MITFALFMISEIYCKLKTLEGNDLDLKRFVDEIYSDTAAKSFSYNPFNDALSSILIEQKLCRKKATDKLPSWVQANCLFATVPLEQATSERVAKAKASLFKGEKLLSLTGGLGSDECAFSSSFNSIVGLDTDYCLNVLVRINNRLLGLNNIQRVDDSAENFLARNNTTFDVIYSDPDRRPGGNRISSDARLYTPNVFDLCNQHKQPGERWLTKLSPMTDITWIRKQFNAPSRIYLFFYKNEIKELLVETADSIQDENIIVSVENDDAYTLFDKQNLNPFAKHDFEVFCELSAASIKAGFGQKLAENCHWQTENNGTYYTGKTTVNPALGRCFRIIERLSGSLNEMGETIQKLGISQASISARDFVADSTEVRKKLGLKDGGENYLFFTGKSKIKKGFVCRKIG